MKIRSDFVTNSSSSNYCLEISLNAKGFSTSVYEDLFDFFPDSGGDAWFDAEISELADHNGKLKSDSVREIAQFLMDHTHNQFDGEDEDELAEIASSADDYETTALEMRDEYLEDRKNFIESCVRNIQSVNEIESIEIKRDCDAWGEFAVFAEESDETLQNLAKRAVRFQKTSSEKKALDTLRKYLSIPHPWRADGSLVSGENVQIRYCWSGDDEELMDLAKELMKGRSRVNGTDVQKLDITNGTFEHYLEWWL